MWCAILLVGRESGAILPAARDGLVRILLLTEGAPWLGYAVPESAGARPVGLRGGLRAATAEPDLGRASVGSSLMPNPTKPFDIAVIGAGAWGSACAWRLARSGAKV